MKWAIILILFIFLVINNKSFAQFEENYSAKTTYSEKDKDLIKKVQGQLDNELRNVHSYKAQKIFKSNTQYLIKQIKNEAFLRDDTLQNYVQQVFSKLLRANQISPKNKSIFVNKNAEINALCFGEGSFFVTVGLLRKIENEGQLAFTLAHELAHYQLDHVKNKVFQMVESNEQKKVNKELDRIINGTVTVDGLEKLRELIYVKNKYSRAVELEADSLGLVFYRNAQYNPNKAIELIDQLDFSNYSKQHLGEKLFLPFHFRKYPFKQIWLKNRLGVYHKKPQKSFIFDLDSIQTHPDYYHRKQKLKLYIDTTETKVNESRQNITTELVIKTAELEAIESAYYTRRYDLALFLALELKPIYPKNDFINTKIIKILLDLYEAHENRILEYFVPQFTTNYHDDIRLVNNFLNNANKKELMGIAFHFMNQKTNFNRNNQEHYYLLWKVAGYNRKFEFQEKIIAAYLEKFPNGEYKVSMK